MLAQSGTDLGKHDPFAVSGAHDIGTAGERTTGIRASRDSIDQFPLPVEERREAPQRLSHVDVDILRLAGTRLPYLGDQDRLGGKRNCADSCVWQPVRRDGI